MNTSKRTVALAVVSVLIALAVPATGQSGSGKPAPDRRLVTWERQLVLPPQLSARLDWADRRFQPSGLRKLKQLARALAPEIAAGAGFDPLRDRASHDVAGSFSKLTTADVSEAAFIVMAIAAKDMDEDIRMIMAEIKATNAAKQKMRDMIKDLNQWISNEMSKHPDSQDVGNEKAGAAGTPVRASGPRAQAKVATVRRITLETKASPVIHFDYMKTPVVPPLPPRASGMTVSSLRSLRDDLGSNLDGMNEMSEMTSLRLQMTMDRRSKFISTLSQIMKKIGTTQETLVQNIK